MINALALKIAAPPALPSLIVVAGEHASIRFLEFFAAAIRNPHTRRAYSQAVGTFMSWCVEMEIPSITAVQPLHVATWIELQSRNHSAPTAKQRLAALRHLFDWLVVGQVVPTNPAASVRGPAYSARKGKTPILEAAEVRALLNSIDVTTPGGLRDRALIAIMVYSLARVSAAVRMKIEDVYTERRRLWVRLHEKGGKIHEMPCHHNLEDYLHAYIEGCGLASDPKGPLFRTIARGSGTGVGSGRLTRTAMVQADAYAMVRRRATAAGIDTKIGNHTFRATGITTYLKAGGALENAAAMANHSSIRTTQLYDRRYDNITLDEIERIIL
jgi:site-specific recombinase XerD